MSDEFYKILNVSPAASADAIRSAHRQLVKRYHPDIYWTEDDKARANDELQRINEAYRVLSNPELRREYDKRQAQQTATGARPSNKPAGGQTRARPKPQAAPRSRPAGPPPRLQALLQSTKAALSRRLKEVRSMDRRRLARRWSDPLTIKWMVGIGGAFALALVVRAVWFPPPTWSLLEKTAIGASANFSQQTAIQHNWQLVGRYGSKSECVQSLRNIVQLDERAGARPMGAPSADGTTAGTVYMKDEEALAEDLFNAKLMQAGSGAVDREALRDQARQQARDYVSKNGLPQRVRSYHCIHAEPASWLRGLLERTGLAGD